MKWQVRWGSWYFVARCTSPGAGGRLFEIELRAELGTNEDGVIIPGTVLRIPTEEGLEYFCKDSFEGDVTLSLYELVWEEDVGEYVRNDTAPVVDRARSRQCAVEIGGGPWWDEWVGQSKMKQPLKGLVKLPYMF